MKESIYGVNYRPEFIKTFNDEQTTRRNGGDPTDIVFENGVSVTNNITSEIKYKNCKLINNKVFPVRFKIKYDNTQSDFS